MDPIGVAAATVTYCTLSTLDFDSAVGLAASLLVAHLFLEADRLSLSLLMALLGERVSLTAFWFV